jgi:gamma-D-glutamyl-L-lysine dipeptidyl-peptidase
MHPDLVSCAKQEAQAGELPMKRRHLALLFLLAPACMAQTATSATVAIPVANMYSSASEDSDVVSQAIYGSDVKVLEESGGWAKVRTIDDYTGWMRLDTTVRMAGERDGDSHSTKTVRVNSQLANLYRETDVTAHRPVLTVPFETLLPVENEGKGDDAGWFQVRLLDGQKAWVQAGDVTTDFRPLSIAESIVLGKRFLGVTYLWGGRSSLGYDCSGFTQMLVRSRGINMPRDADLQAAWSGVMPVDRKHLRAGDLLFFGSAPDHITHTGMYIGKGQFIHDTIHDHPGVQISRLRDQPWTRLLVACRRVK